MEQLLQLFILIPLAGFLISLMLPRKSESLIAVTAITTVSFHLLGAMTFVIAWLINQYPILDVKHATLFRSADIEIFISFFFDKTTAAYAVVGSLIALIVSIFSRTYMHRESGFKRYFNTLLFFFAGYNVVIFSGNFETLFIGWEMVGITSFLL